MMQECIVGRKGGGTGPRDRQGNGEPAVGSSGGVLSFPHPRFNLCIWLHFHLSADQGEPENEDSTFPGLHVTRGTSHVCPKF